MAERPHPHPRRDLDVTPAPAPDELAAILAALEDEPRPEESPWWRAGLPHDDRVARGLAEPRRGRPPGS